MTEGTAGEEAGEPGEPGDTERRLTVGVGRADLRAVAGVRRALRDLLRCWERAGRAETAELLTSELVTNALLHTDQEALVTATLSAGRLRVEVRDFDGGDPRPRVPDADTGTHGRGLLLVEALSDVWGVRQHTVGKSVWFELRARDA
jgi:anti-sigma regulatory factor (Ser/Thr protein kinase)